MAYGMANVEADMTDDATREELSRIMREPPRPSAPIPHNPRKRKPPRWAVVAELPDGSTIAKCRVCPKWAHDRRTPANPAVHQSIALQDGAAVHVWIKAHADTDIHKWYLNAPAAAPMTERELIAWRVLNKSEPPTRKQPFPHLGVRRGAHPKW